MSPNAGLYPLRHRQQLGKTSINQAAINIRIIDDIEPEKTILSQMTDIAAMIRVATNCLIMFELSCPGSTAMLTFAHNKQCCEYTDAAQRQERPAYTGATAVSRFLTDNRTAQSRRKASVPIIP